eukprot:scaffold2769_cov253-Pinguiococcus_pyrenoidosus.AAC.4
MGVLRRGCVPRGGETTLYLMLRPDHVAKPAPFLQIGSGFPLRRLLSRGAKETNKQPRRIKQLLLGECAQVETVFKEKEEKAQHKRTGVDVEEDPACKRNLHVPYTFPTRRFCSLRSRITGDFRQGTAAIRRECRGTAHLHCLFLASLVDLVPHACVSASTPTGRGASAWPSARDLGAPELTSLPDLLFAPPRAEQSQPASSPFHRRRLASSSPPTRREAAEPPLAPAAWPRWGRGRTQRSPAMPDGSRSRGAPSPPTLGRTRRQSGCSCIQSRCTSSPETRRAGPSQRDFRPGPDRTLVLKPNSHSKSGAGRNCRPRRRPWEWTPAVGPQERLLDCADRELRIFICAFASGHLWLNTPASLAKVYSSPSTSTPEWKAPSPTGYSQSLASARSYTCSTTGAPCAVRPPVPPP